MGNRTRAMMCGRPDAAAITCLLTDLEKSIGTVSVKTLRAKAADVSLQLRDLILQPAAMRLVLLRIDRFLLECRVFLTEGIYFASQLLVLRVEVVAFAHKRLSHAGRL